MVRFYRIIYLSETKRVTHALNNGIQKKKKHRSSPMKVTIEEEEDDLVLQRL